MNDLRREVGRLESSTQRDAMTTLARMKAAGLHTFYTLVGCIVFGMIFTAAAAWRIRRAIRGRVDLLVQKARKLAKGEDIGPRLGDNDEIADLDRAFHDMAELLAERTRNLERYRLLADRTECLMLFARQHDGRIVHANAAALTAYRYSLAEMRELSDVQLQSGEIPKAIAEQLTTPSVSLASTIVGTGRAALAAVIAERYDVVLMDCFMPEMDGYDATRAIRRHQVRSGEHTPIIAMTANAQSEDRDTCITAGVDDYLPKPVTLASLRDALARCCLPGDEVAGAHALQIAS